MKNIFIGLFLLLFLITASNVMANEAVDSLPLGSPVPEEGMPSYPIVSPVDKQKNLDNVRPEVVPDNVPPPDNEASFPEIKKEHDDQDKDLPDISSGLKVGDKIVYSGSVDATTGKMYFSQINPGGFVVVVFYEGYWSESDHKLLKSYESQRKALKKLNAKIVAVSADLPEYAKKMVEDNRLGFDVLSDPGATLIQAFHVLSPHLKVVEGLSDQDQQGNFLYAIKYKFEEKSINVQEYTGRKDNAFAIPSVFILNKGTVIFASVDGDIEFKDIINAITAYKSAPQEGKAVENDLEGKPEGGTEITTEDDSEKAVEKAPQQTY